MKKLLFIYNPISGKGMIKNRLADIIAIMSRSGYDISVFATSKRGDATEKVYKDAADYDRIVCCGGDGTLNEVAKGLLLGDHHTTLGYIPAGSTNDYGMSLGLGADMIQSAKIAVADNLVNLDLGCFNDNFFVYVAAFGLFSEVSYSTDQNLKNMLGHFAYLLSAVKSLADIPSVPLQVEADGKVYRGDYIYGMITNSLRVGGLKDFIKGDVKFDDGLFEVMLINSPKNPIELTEIGAVLTNLRKDSNLVHTFRASNIKITAKDELAWSLDGEFGGDVKVANIVNKNKAFCLATNLRANLL